MNAKYRNDDFLRVVVAAIGCLALVMLSAMMIKTSLYTTVFMRSVLDGAGYTHIDFKHSSAASEVHGCKPGDVAASMVQAHDAQHRKVSLQVCCRRPDGGCTARLLNYLD